MEEARQEVENYADAARIYEDEAKAANEARDLALTQLSLIAASAVSKSTLGSCT